MHAPSREGGYIATGHGMRACLNPSRVNSLCINIRNLRSNTVFFYSCHHERWVTPPMFHQGLLPNREASNCVHYLYACRIRTPTARPGPLARKSSARNSAFHFLGSKKLGSDCAEFGVDYTASQIRKLARAGIPTFH